jgi:hypothetical protein
MYFNPWNCRVKITADYCSIFYNIDSMGSNYILKVLVGKNHKIVATLQNS